MAGGWRFLLLALAVVCSAWLGSLHRAVHWQGHSHEQAHEHSPEDAEHPASAGELLKALFASHDDGDAPCFLWDHLTHSDTPVPSSSLPVLPGTACLAQARAQAIARWHSIAQARGPPSHL